MDILPVDVEEGSGKRTVTCALLWMRSMVLRPGCRGQRGGDTGVCGAAVWGRAALYLAGVSCDWLGGNIEKYEHGA